MSDVHAAVPEKVLCQFFKVGNNSVVSQFKHNRNVKANLCFGKDEV